MRLFVGLSPPFACSPNFFILICSEVARNDSFLVNLIDFTALRMFFASASLERHSWPCLPALHAGGAGSLRRLPTVSSTAHAWGFGTIRPATGPRRGVGGAVTACHSPRRV